MERNMTFKRPMTAEEIEKELRDCRKLDVYVRLFDSEGKKKAMTEISRALGKTEATVRYMRNGKILIRPDEKETIEKTIGIPLFSMDKITVNL